MVRRKAGIPKRRSRIFRLLVALLFIAGFTALGTYILSLPIWEIKEVIINGTKMLSEGEVRTLAAIPLSENLFFTDFSRTESNLGKITVIESFKIYRIPPATVLINIKERKPIATLVFSDNSMIIDEEGYILNRNPNLTLDIPNLANLPIVTGIEKNERLQAKRIDERTAQVISEIILKLSRFLDSSRMQLELGGLENVSFLLDDLLRVKVGEAEEVKKKMEVFEALLPVIVGRWAEVEYVDVRYPDNPVIRFK